MSDRLPGTEQYRTPDHYRSLTHARLLQILEYDAATGIFRWKIRPGRNRKTGSVAGGRINIVFEGETYAKSHLAWFYATGGWSRRTIGRRNGNSFDVSFANLIERATGGFDHDLSTQEGRAAYRKAHNLNNPEHHHAHHIARYRGMTPEKYRAMLKVQGGRCAICRRPETAKIGGKEKALSVDHCHATEAVRGLLCDACNRMLGLARDVPSVLEAGARYLRGGYQ